MDSCSVRSHSQPQRHFHETDGSTSQSQSAPQSLSPVLGWEFSEAWYIDWLSFMYPYMTQHKRMRRRGSRGGNAVSRNNFSCEVRECHDVCKNFGGAIARFARSWLRPCLSEWILIWAWIELGLNLLQIIWVNAILILILLQFLFFENPINLILI